MASAQIELDITRGKLALSAWPGGRSRRSLPDGTASERKTARRVLRPGWRKRVTDGTFRENFLVPHKFLRTRPEAERRRVYFPPEDHAAGRRWAGRESERSRRSLPASMSPCLAPFPTYITSMRDLFFRPEPLRSGKPGL
ncbi:hypothetical protein ES708_09137 [subsurface metagenome]